MASKRLGPIPKTTVKIWEPVIHRFNEKIDSACLRRDAYLARVLDVEVDWLDQEVSLPNSQAAHNYVLRELDRLDRKLVTLALPLDLTQRVNAVCARKRIVRDAFFNRLFLLLAASPRVIDRLLFDNGASEWRHEVWSECRSDGPFWKNGFYPLEPTIDPFWAVRNGLEILARQEASEEYLEPESGKTIRVQRSIFGEPQPISSLYTTIFDKSVTGKSLIGLSCYVPDSRVPGHDAERTHKARLDELLDELGG